MDEIEGIVGVALGLDLKELKSLGVIDPNDAVIFGKRATKQAIAPKLQRESVRVFTFPVYRPEREEMFSRIFERYEMPFDRNLVEEVWGIPARLRRVEECHRIVILSHESSVLYRTKSPFGAR